MSIYQRVVRWLARREIEAAWRERAEAVNDAINWRGHYDDVTIVGRARGEALTALVNANAMTPAQISLAAVRLAKMDLPAEVRDLAIQELNMHVPSEGSDE